mmetsp:Transcript_26227/g.36961  ORF Transcript_26227/g.36961 Transcript_26227/m.36961 type:complete len:210 (-) Transcript_26227:2363-2992(-)
MTNTSNIGSKSTTGTSVMKSPGRRVVKASPPPPIKLEEDREPTAVAQDKEDNEPSPKKKVSVAIKDPAVMHEMEQELNERWREEHLHAVAGGQERRREKKIDEIRKHPPTPQNSVDDFGDKTATTAIESQVLPEFSVQPQFPEHKRSVERTDTTVGEEPVEKRLKASDPDDDEPEKKLNPYWSAFKSALPAIAVAGVAIFVAAKYMKRR